MANEWVDPKSDYIPTDQVTPEIFNRLAVNEKHLKEISCQVVTKEDAASEEITVNNIVLLKVT